jgi:hypothetical protein
LRQPEVHAIFFDDCIEEDDSHIIDVRDAESGHSVHYNHTKNVHLFRAEPYHIIKDPQNYFWNKIKTVMKN